jgi:hypothetical protein
MPLSQAARNIIARARELAEQTHWTQNSYGKPKGFVTYTYGTTEDGGYKRIEVEADKMQACTVGLLCYAAREQAGTLKNSLNDFVIYVTDEEINAGEASVLPAEGREAIHAVAAQLGASETDIDTAEGAIINWNDAESCTREDVLTELGAVLSK